VTPGSSATGGSGSTAGTSTGAGGSTAAPGSAYGPYFMPGSGTYTGAAAGTTAVVPTGTGNVIPLAGTARLRRARVHPTPHAHLSANSHPRGPVAHAPHAARAPRHKRY
jgi:hypothetical protein